MTRLKQFSLILTDATTDNGPGLQITSNPSSPASQSSVVMQDFNGSPYITVGNDNNQYGVLLWGDYMAALSAILTPQLRIDGGNPNPSIQWPDNAGATSSGIVQGQNGMQLWSGSGPPHGYVLVTSAETVSTWRFVVASNPFETTGTPVRFGATGGGLVTSPSITLRSVVYYAKFEDSTHFTLWTDAALTNQVKPSVSGTATIQSNCGPRYDGSSGQPCPNVGDMYIRVDTPSTAGQRVYVCTARGASKYDTGTWTGVK